MAGREYKQFSYLHLVSRARGDGPKVLPFDYIASDGSKLKTNRSLCGDVIAQSQTEPDSE